ncbi:MAG: type III pantothenate kinase [Christensenellales bacterium]|jgi:type III pantothenate kinase
MILTMDAGNTSIKLGIYDDNGHMRQYGRISTDINKTSDEYGLTMLSVFQYAHIDPVSVKGVIYSSVVPSLNVTLENMCHTFFHLNPFCVGPGMKTGMAIKYDNSRELGADRICTAVAAYEKYGGPCVVIDFGTATTFGAISDTGDFLGGAIMPGVKVSLQGLITGTARLPNIEIKKPNHVIGKNTVENMQSGLLYGYTGAVETLIKRIKKEMGYVPKKIKVIATGGLARVMVFDNQIIDTIDSYLTIDGLYILYKRNTVLA